MTTQATKTFVFGQQRLSYIQALELARGQREGLLDEAAKAQVRRSQSRVEAMVEKGDPVYGINTGFGPLCTTQISKEETRELQVNILKSHSVGVGQPVEAEIAALMLVLKAQSLAQGHSGIRLETLERIVWHISNQAIPIVPSQGSVGASGDLAPLSHLFLPLIGLGKVVYGGEVISTAELYEKTGLKALELGPKEGLALINGTQFIAAHAVKVVEKLQQCLSQADLIAAMMIDALQGSVKPFHPALHELRAFEGNQHVAARIRAVLQGSEIMDDHANCLRVQDPYSLRCVPQVHGSSRNAWKHLKELVEVEINSVTDNPVIIDDELTISGGSFHGQPLAMAIDYACLAASELGNISDRRVYLSLEGKYPGVPKLLLRETGTHSGYMLLQYTTAALASENKTSCFPASADSIPTSLGQEDHVSMGSISGRKALKVIRNVEKILAIELLVAAQALDFRRPMRSTPIIEGMHALVRERVSFADKDRVFAEDIEAVLPLVQEGELVNLAHTVAQQESIAFATALEDIFEPKEV